MSLQQGPPGLRRWRHCPTRIALTIARRCNGTISVFADTTGAEPLGQPALGVCVRAGVAPAASDACGALGQRCCRQVDQAGWGWHVCGSGQLGMFCAADGRCRPCASRGGSAAARPHPGAANVC
jgi:hypothetical protein